MLATPLQLSVAVAEPVLLGLVEAVQSIVTLVGQMIVGPWVSRTVMVCVQVAMLPLLSVAFHVRVIVLTT